MQQKQDYDYNHGNMRQSEYRVKENLIPSSGPLRTLFIVLPLTALVLLTAILVLGVSMSQDSRKKMLSPISEEEEAVYRIKNDSPKDYTPYVKQYEQDASEKASVVQDREISPTVTESGLQDMISQASGVPEVRTYNPERPLDTPIDPSTDTSEEDVEQDDQTRFLHLTGSGKESEQNQAQSQNGVQEQNSNNSGDGSTSSNKDLQVNSNTPSQNGQEEQPNAEARSRGGEPKVEVRDTVSDALPLSAAYDEKPFFPTWKKRWVAVDLANVREDAALDSERLTQVIKGAVVTEIETNGDWSYVEVDSKCKGYIYSNLLSDEEVEPNEEEPEFVYSSEKLEELQTPCDVILYANASAVRIRKTPSLKGEIITDMYYGDYVHAVSYGYDWYKIELKDGKFGYVHGKYLQKEPIETEDLINDESHVAEVVQQMKDQGYEIGAVAPQAPTTVSQGALGLVDLAMKYVGYPYVYGATGPNAFDCSGFVQFLHAQMGVSIGRTTYQQVYDGIDVPFAPDDFSHMLPGDIILLAQGSDVYHSMLYIGNGQVVHAGSPQTGVNIDNLSYYAHHMAYVKRIFY